MKLKFHLLASAVVAGGLSLSTWAQTGAVPPVAQTTPAPATDPAAGVKAPVSDSWDGLKDCTYEKRDAFADRLERMAGKLEADVGEMNAKLTGLPNAVAKERDKTNKEFATAHANLKSQLADLRTGTAGTWDNAKEKVAQSWQDEQAAYEKVKSSPTS